VEINAGVDQGLISAEWLTAASAFATLFVIAITAYAGLRQIRHMRSGNQVAALLPLAEKYSELDLQESLQYIISGALQRDLENEDVRRGIEAIPTTGPGRKAMVIANFYESVGALVTARVLDIDLILRYFTLPSDLWAAANDYIAITRRSRGSEVFENFEALVALEKRYAAKHGTSLYPRNLPRVEVRDSYAAKDASWSNLVRQ
jgi:hypothetical protein